MADDKDSNPVRNIVDAHAAIGHLLKQWDLAWQPHQAFAQLTAIEACLHAAERATEQLEEAKAAIPQTEPATH